MFIDCLQIADVMRKQIITNLQLLANDMVSFVVRFKLDSTHLLELRIRTRLHVVRGLDFASATGFIFRRGKEIDYVINVKFIIV